MKKEMDEKTNKKSVKKNEEKIEGKVEKIKEEINTVIKFDELELSSNIKRALADNGYIETTPIQAKTIPHILDGKDIIGQSQTGTGKTASYGLPMIQGIDTNLDKVQAIVLCPTRELAVQVTGELRKFTKYQENVKCLAVYGGESIEKQIKDLKRGVKIVVGTPGRVMDHMRRKTLKLDNIKMVVLDEADEMLNMGFEEDIETILSDVPKERQTVLFSATMNKRILGIANKYSNNPVNVKIKSKELTVDKIEQILIEIKGKMKDEAVARLIDVNNPKKAVVFCNTKKKVDELLEILKKKKYKAESLHGDIKQAQRDRIMKRFKQGEFQILIATDVVARGIDVDELELVINYDIPQEDEYYVHRVGRTGRNGNIGKAYTFVVGREKNKIASIQKYANTKLTLGNIPTDNEVRKVKNKKIVSQIQDIINKQDDIQNNINDEIMEELLKQNDIKQIAKALLEIVNEQKNDSKKDLEIQEKINSNSQNGKIKLFFNVGKKDKIMVKDIVGSITSNVAIPGSEIGKINILDKFSFVEVPVDYAQEIIDGMKDKQIKGRNVNIEIAN